MTLYDVMLMRFSGEDMHMGECTSEPDVFMQDKKQAKELLDKRLRNHGMAVNDEAPASTDLEQRFTKGQTIARNVYQDDAALMV